MVLNVSTRKYRRAVRLPEGDPPGERGVAAAIQRCQVHKGRNIIERLPEHLHATGPAQGRDPGAPEAALPVLSE